MGRRWRDEEEDDLVDWGDVWLSRREANAEHEMNRMQDDYENFLFRDPE